MSDFVVLLLLLNICFTFYALQDIYYESGLTLILFTERSLTLFTHSVIGAIK